MRPINTAIDKYAEPAISVLLLALNVGCVFLFYMIEESVGGSKFERTALSFWLQYVSWATLALFLATLISFKRLKAARAITVALTMLNIFAVLGGVVCAMPFRL